jgi:LmbE family N-acetylglucosaminyl deacetylase
LCQIMTVRSMDKKTMLVLAPHTDDGEMGCGGTIAKAIENDVKVYMIAFSSADESLRPGLRKGTLREEMLMANEKLGVLQGNVLCLQYNVRTFSYNRQMILDEMYKMNQTIQPDIVLAPSIHDVHQDHKVIAEEARRVFKRTTLLSYELPWNNFSFDTSAFVVLDERHLDKKMKALECYKSQDHKEYFAQDFIKSMAIMRGVQINQKYAEAFEVVRWIV